MTAPPTPDQRSMHRIVPWVFVCQGSCISSPDPFQTTALAEAISDFKFADNSTASFPALLPLSPSLSSMTACLEASLADFGGGGAGSDHFGLPDPELEVLHRMTELLCMPQV